MKTVTLSDCEVIGVGAHGKVLKGTYDGKTYAVKRRYISEGSPDGCIHVSEIDALSRLQHPHILHARITQRYSPISDNFKHDHYDPLGNRHDQKFRADLIYILTDAATSDLRSMCHSPIPLEKVRRWMSQLLDAIIYIHDQGFIHRDIKPHNILYFQETDDMRICDFDMFIPDIPDLIGQKLMTPEYTPPEICVQNVDVAYTKKVDIWGLGLVLLFMVQGKPLLNRDKAGEMDMDEYFVSLFKRFFPNGHILEGKVETTDTINIIIGIEEVDDLLSHMLDCDPNTRWDGRQCLAHPFFQGVSIPPIPPPLDHVIETHHISDEMAKVFDHQITNGISTDMIGLFLGLDILMRVCKTPYSGNHRKLAICCYNIGMKYFHGVNARCIQIDDNDTKILEYRIIAEKLKGVVYRDTVYNHIQLYHKKIYKYMMSPLFPRRLSEVVDGVKAHLSLP